MVAKPSHYKNGQESEPVYLRSIDENKQNVTFKTMPFYVVALCNNGCSMGVGRVGLVFLIKLHYQLYLPLTRQA